MRYYFITTWNEIVKNRILLIMLLPTVVFFIVFSYIPMAGIVLAFKRYSFSGGIFGSPWVGLENFKFLLYSGDDVFRAVRNTVLYNLVFILVNNALQTLCAIILAEISTKWFKKLSQGIMFLPYFVSWVVVGAIAYNLFNYEHGFINGILLKIGVERIDVYSNPNYWIFIVIFVCAWKYLGYGTVIYLAGIMGIDTKMYEAAEIDGANIFQRIWYITLPCLIPVAIILFLLALGNVFRGDFSMFYQLVGENSLLFPTTDVIDTFVVRSLLRSSEIGMSAAVGLIQSVFCFFTIIIANYLIKRYNEDYSLF